MTISAKAKGSAAYEAAFVGFILAGLAVSLAYEAGVLWLYNYSSAFASFFHYTGHLGIYGVPIVLCVLLGYAMGAFNKPSLVKIAAVATVSVLVPFVAGALVFILACVLFRACL